MQHQYHHSNMIVISQRQDIYNLDSSHRTLMVNQPISSLTINGSNNQIIINAHIHNIIINGNSNSFSTPSHSQASTSRYLSNVIFNGQKNHLQCHSPRSVCSIVNGMGNKINGRQITPSYQQQQSNYNVYNNFDGSSFNININNNSFQNRSNFSNVGNHISNLLNMVFSNIGNQGNNNGNVHFSSVNYHNNNYEDSDDDGEYEDEEGEFEEFEDEEEAGRVNMRKARENVILNFDEFQFKHANKYIKNIEDKCAICLEKFLKTDIVKRFACGDHIFHKKCLTLWLKKSNLCPLCKFNLLSLVGKPEYQNEEKEEEE